MSEIFQGQCLYRIQTDCNHPKILVIDWLFPPSSSEHENIFSNYVSEFQALPSPRSLSSWWLWWYTVTLCDDTDLSSDTSTESILSQQWGHAPGLWRWLAWRSQGQINLVGYSICYSSLLHFMHIKKISSWIFLPSQLVLTITFGGYFAT